MRLKNRRLFYFLCGLGFVVASFGAGMAAQQHVVKPYIFKNMPDMDREAVCLSVFSRRNERWSAPLNTRATWAGGQSKQVFINAADKTKKQSAYFFATKSAAPRPLIVSLHSWNADFSQADTLANIAEKADVNYIHPDFQGLMDKPSSCCSEQVVSDIDDAIDYAIKNGHVDPNEVYIYGVSGGAYSALCAYSHLSHKVKKYMVWAAITDLEAWYYQSGVRRNAGSHKYDQDILACTGSKSALNKDEARKRSPMYRPVVKSAPSAGEIYLYAGVWDGVNGAVPVTHSIDYYNMFVTAAHPEDGWKARLIMFVKKMSFFEKPTVSDQDLIKIMKYNGENSGVDMIADRKVVLRKDHENIHLVIFEGVHESLPQYAFEQLIKP